MKRTAGMLVLLAVLNGCASPDPGPGRVVRTYATQPQMNQGSPPYPPSPPPQAGSVQQPVAAPPRQGTMQQYPEGPSLSRATPQWGIQQMPAGRPVLTAGYPRQTPYAPADIQHVQYGTAEPPGFSGEGVAEPDLREDPPAPKPPPPPPLAPAPALQRATPQPTPAPATPLTPVPPAVTLGSTPTAPARLTAFEVPTPDHSALTLPGVTLVNTRRVVVNYEVKDAGPAGSAPVELWYTENGGAWIKNGSPPQQNPPFVVEVPGEGRYGFTLVAVPEGGSGQPPQADELPQVSVEVDQTPPVVRLLSARNDAGPDTRIIHVQWSANDRNLAPRPITLSLAKEATGPWQALAVGLENTGRHTWKAPPGVPGRIFVRVEAADLAGNVGSAVLPQPVLLEGARPTVTIRNVEPLEAHHVQRPKLNVSGVQPAGHRE